MVRRQAQVDTVIAAQQRAAQRVAWIAVAMGVLIMAMKFGVFWWTRSAVVLGDAMESIVNIVAAVVASVSTWYAARPADEDHPYGHGKVEFVAVGIEGALIVIAALSIIAESSRRLVAGTDLVQNAAWGVGALGGANLCVLTLALFVWWQGRKLRSPTLVADGKHLMTDFITTAAAMTGLGLVWLTGRWWVDSVSGIAIGLLILIAGGALLVESFGGLMDRADPQTDQAIRELLDHAVAGGEILSYHKVRHRRVGSFHWVDMHLQLPAQMTVAAAHEVASRVERRIEDRLGRAKATAHIEPPIR